MTVQVTIIGMGQIGASIGLALAEHKDLVFRVGHDKDIRNANQAKQLGALDRVDINIPHAVEGAGLVILALPVDQIRETLAAMAQDLPEDAVVMDTAPVKEAVLGWAAELLPPRRYYVGLTPAINPSYLETAGSGVETAHADLFKDGLFTIVTGLGTPSQAIKLAADFCRLLGAEHMFIDPVEVDSLMAATHLVPQMAAAALANTLIDQPGWREGRKLAGRPFCLGTSPVVDFDDSASLARGALLLRPHLLRVLTSLIDNLSALRKALLEEDAEQLASQLQNARTRRQHWGVERWNANWAATEAAPPVELPTAKEVFSRMFGIGRKKKPGQDSPK